MNSKVINNNYYKISIITKIYTLALIFEPLIYFVFSGGESSGINLSLARFLQLIILIYFILNYFNTKRKKINILENINKYILKYIIIIILGTIISLIFFDNYKSTYQNTNITTFKNIFRGQYFRPIIEFFIIIYYFLFYIILPKSVFISKYEIDYFFKTFKKILIFILIFGFIDFIYCLLIPGEFLIGRHLSDNMYVGVRFHSFCGEPRDAFVFLIFSLVLLTLESIINKNKPSKIFFISIIIAIILTQSASGILGLFFTIILLIFFTNNFNFKLLIYTIIFILFLITISILLINYSERLSMYYDAYKEIYFILKSNEELPYLLYIQSVNIFPIWKIFINTVNFRWIPVLFGSGIGSSSFLNNSIVQTEDLANTNSQLVRSLYEVGLFGTYYFIKIFTSYYFKFKEIAYINNKLFYYLFFLLIGANLSHRSTTIYIATGLILILTNFTKAKKLI